MKFKALLLAGLLAGTSSMQLHAGEGKGKSRIITGTTGIFLSLANIASNQKLSCDNLVTLGIGAVLLGFGLETRDEKATSFNGFFYNSLKVAGIAAVGAAILMAAKK